MMSLILASASTVRAHLLRQAGVIFDVRAADVDEKGLMASFSSRGTPPEQVPAVLAELKALRISAEAPEAFVIGCDQVLVHDGQLIGKSADLGAARALLQTLRGKSHSLETACVMARAGTVVWRHQERAVLHMRVFSDAFVDAYLYGEGAAILGSVGCYHLEGRGVQLFDRVEGDYFSILGLPLVPMLAALRENGMMTT